MSLNWTWPSRGEAARSLTLMIVGVVGFAAGSRLHDTGNDIVRALDAWSLGIAGLAAWGLRRSALDVSADWYHQHLAVCMVVAVPLVLWTMEGPSLISTRPPRERSTKPPDCHKLPP